MKTIAVVLGLCAIGLRAEAQLVTNQPARYPCKIVCFEKANPGIRDTCINPTPDSVNPGDHGEETCTSSESGYTLKWRFAGRNRDGDVYDYTFGHSTDPGDPSLQTDAFKEIQFNGKPMVVFDDAFYQVLMKSPDPEDLKPSQK
jgi:hypothetical protein